MMRIFGYLLAWFLLSPPAWASPAPAKPAELIHQAPNPNPTAAYKWLDLLLEASARDVDRSGARPTVLSRTMSIVMTAMYDAWAAYDEKAVGTRFGDKLRRPKKERSQKNKEIAIAYAVYRSLLGVYPEDEKWISQQMRDAGFDPMNDTKDREDPAGIGNVAAAAVLAYRRHDGSNQFGDEAGSDGKPYSDYTFYRPQNRPDFVQNPNFWMPIPFKDSKGGIFMPGFLTAHWYRVKPFALEKGSQFRPVPPPEWGSKQLTKDVEECVEVNGKLTLEQKAIVEFMRDGPRSTAQSGHWLRFSQDVSRRDRNSLDQDVRLFFAVANVVFDTFVSSWDAKRYYDSSRPYWYVRQHFPNKKVLGWAGPGKGVKKVNAKEWLPYSPENFITPPFPGYISGHATASAGAARMLEYVTGSETFGAVAIREVGDLTEATFSTAEMQAREGKKASNVPASKEIRLSLPTFMATAEMAAISRLWGGYHIRTDNEVGLDVGKKIADYSWPKYRAYFEGSAIVEPTGFELGMLH